MTISPATIKGRTENTHGNIRRWRKYVSFTWKHNDLLYRPKLKSQHEINLCSFERSDRTHVRTLIIHYIH